MILCSLILLIIFSILLFSENNTEHFMPNEEKFIICPNKFTKVNNNYSNTLNYIDEPKDGFYTHLLKLSNEKKDNNYFQSTICDQHKDFNDKINYNNKIIDSQNNNDIIPIDPLYNYPHPKNNNSILYPTKYQQDMLIQKQKDYS
tara:strand:- start:25 stop:459 length:435 start_codon:yes stop_codon:yes gene_type:complete